jgi:protein-tyrosine-phosphatase
MSDSPKKLLVLFLCTGNTCRSPLAEGILKKMLKEKNLSPLEVQSAGIQTLDGMPSSLFAGEVAKNWGIDLVSHRSQKLTEELLEKTDLVLALAPEHYHYVKSNFRKHLPKVYLLKSFPQKKSLEKELGVPDPIGGTIQEYNEVLLEIEEEIKRIFPYIQKMVETGGAAFWRDLKKEK